MASRKGLIAVVSGFSGAGKGTVMKRLLSDYDCYALSVSMTTRTPREGEVDGREYFFVDETEFRERIENDGLVEYTCYCGNYYGTPKSYVDEKLKEGKDVILEIEVDGALQIKKKFPQTLLIFMTPPNIDILKSRLMGRGTESKEQVANRLKRALEEAENIEQYDYLIVNDDLDECVKTVHEAIRAAHMVPGRLGGFIGEIKEELRDVQV